MATLKVQFKNNQFYLEDGSRLIFTERQFYTISGDDRFFSNHDEMLDAREPRTHESVQYELEREYGKENLIKMLPAGTVFHFNLGLGKKKKGVQERLYTFEGLLEEDLYLRLKSGNPINIPESWVITDCITTIKECTSKNFKLQQKVSAETLGRAFALLVSTHFSQQRSTSISIYNYFKTNFPVSDKQLLGFMDGIMTFGQIREMVLRQNLNNIKELEEKIVIGS